MFVGLASFAAGWLYTGGPKPYGYAGFGEVFVFLFFGVVATVGSAYVQSARITGLAVGAAVPVGFLATALLVVNNLRDIPGDTRSGKRTLAVRIGDRRTRVLYVSLLVGAVAAVPLVSGLGGRPGGALALIAIPFAQRPVTAVLSGARGPHGRTCLRAVMTSRTRIIPTKAARGIEVCDRAFGLWYAAFFFRTG